MQADLHPVQTQWTQFVKSATLDVIFPKSKAVKPSDVVTLGATDVDRLASRQYVLFDELVNLQVILRARQSPEALQDILQHLDLTVTAHATNATADGNSNVNPATTKHDVASVKINAADHAASHSLTSVSHVVWRAALPITRPRARLQRPTIYFSAHLSLSDKAAEKIKQSNIAYMPSYEPLPSNVLAPLRFAPGLMDTDLFLSEQRITRVAPNIAQPDGLPKVLRGTSRRAYPAMPALFPRIQYQMLPKTSFVCLRLVASELLSAQITVRETDIAIQDRLVERVDAIRLPHSMQAGDVTSFIFKLSDKLDRSASMIATTSLKASVMIDIDNEIDLARTWHTPFEPGRSLDHVVHHEWKPAVAREVTSLGAHVTFTISAPAFAILGQPFAMRLLCVNHSTIERTFTASWASSATDVLIIKPQHQLGPIQPGACFELDFELVAEQAGVLNLGSLDIEDVHTGRTIRLHEMPDVEAVALVGGSTGSSVIPHESINNHPSLLAV